LGIFTEWIALLQKPLTEKGEGKFHEGIHRALKNSRQVPNRDDSTAHRIEKKKCKSDQAPLPKPRIHFILLGKKKGKEEI